MIAVGPAFADSIRETINGLDHGDVLAAIVDGVTEGGGSPRLIRVRRVADVAFIAHDGARLSGSGVALGVQSKGTAVIHRADLQPLDNLELFGMSPLYTLESYRAMGRNAAGYALGRRVGPVPDRARQLRARQGDRAHDAAARARDPRRRARSGARRARARTARCRAIGSRLCDAFFSCRAARRRHGAAAAGCGGGQRRQLARHARQRTGGLGYCERRDSVGDVSRQAHARACKTGTTPSDAAQAVTARDEYVHRRRSRASARRTRRTAARRKRRRRTLPTTLSGRMARHQRRDRHEQLERHVAQQTAIVKQQIAASLTDISTTNTTLARAGRPRAGDGDEGLGRLYGSRRRARQSLVGRNCPAVALGIPRGQPSRRAARPGASPPPRPPRGTAARAARRRPRRARAPARSSSGCRRGSGPSPPRCPRGASAGSRSSRRSGGANVSASPRNAERTNAAKT